MASTVKRISSGDTACLMSLSSCIRTSSICRRPEVSTIMTSKPFSLAYFLASIEVFKAFTNNPLENTSTSIDCASVFNCSTAAGRTRSPATRRTFLPCFLKMLAILAACVVLPVPCKPTIMMVVKPGAK